MAALALAITWPCAFLNCGGNVGGAGGHDASGAGSEGGSVVGPHDGSATDQESPSTGDGSMPCRTDSDCPQPSEQYCLPCFEGGVSCAHSQCDNGVCQGQAAGNCPGPINDPCASKSCGDACQQCSTADGGCYPGTCNWLGACKSSTPICSPSAPRGCAVSDAVGVGDCNDFLGWAWDGTACIAVVGCLCQGSDCGTLLVSSFDCVSTFLPCGGDGG